MRPRESIPIIVLVAVGILYAPPGFTLESVLSLDEAKAMLGEGVVGESLADAPLPDPRTLLPDIPGAHTYDVVAGKHAGSKIIEMIKTATDPDHPDLWQIHISDTRIMSVNVSDDALWVSSLAVHEHNLLIEYLSGEPLIVKGMMPGDRISHRTEVRAVKLNHPSQQRSSGFLDTDVTYMGRVRVTTPAGEFDCFLIRRDIRSDVKPVKQSDTIYSFVAPGVGVVARANHLDVAAALIYRQDKRTAVVLAKSP